MARIRKTPERELWIWKTDRPDREHGNPMVLDPGLGAKPCFETTSNFCTRRVSIRAADLENPDAL